MKRVLFIDRDGTIINEAPPTYQIDDFYKLSFYPKVFKYLSLIAKEMDYELVIITNQDGLGTDSFPEKTFWPVQDFIMETLANEDIHFSAVYIDKTLPAENAATRKPRTGLLTAYINNPAYDLANSFVIGDRITDIQLAKNLGCKAIWLKTDASLGAAEVDAQVNELTSSIALETIHWADIYSFLKLGLRSVTHERNTNETKITVALNLDGSGKTAIDTGIGFFDHMLDQIARHGQLDLSVQTK